MRPRARQLPIVLIAIGGLMLGACTAAPASQAPSDVADGTVDLRVAVWTGSEAHLSLFNEIGAAYAALDPRIGEITFETLPFEQYTTVLTTQLAGGSPPDLGWIFETNAPQFVDAGVLTDLAPRLREAEGYNIDDLSATAMSLWVRDEAIYAYPFSTSPFAVFFNAELFNAAGMPTPQELYDVGDWSWEQAAEAARAIVAAEPEAYGLVVRDFDFSGWDFLASMWRGFGADPWSPDGTACTFDSPEMVEAMEFFHEMVFVDRSHPGPGESADFFAGDAGMTITQISRASLLTDVEWEWGVVPLPAGPAGNAQVTGQAGWAVFSAGQQPDIASDFLAFVTNEENSVKLAQFFPPPRESLLTAETLAQTNPLLSQDQLQAVVIDGIASGAVKPSHPNFAQLRDTVRSQLDALWQPDADVASVLAAVCEAIEPQLAP